jgi:hypothetical protein
MATKDSKSRVSKKTKVIVMNKKRKTIRRKNKVSCKTNGGGGHGQTLRK